MTDPIALQRLRAPLSTTFLAALVAASLGLSACDEAEPDPEPEVPPSAPDCSTEIFQPPSFIDAAPTELADAHADTFGAEPAPRFVRYQWPSRDPSTAAAFTWQTDLATMATVAEWGEGSSLDNRVEGASYDIEEDGEDHPGGVRIHEVRLCGDLQPATTYSYRVGGDDSWSETYQFTTPGAPGSFDSVRVAVVGDSRGGYDTWETLVGLIEAHEPDLYLFSGDMVELGVAQDEWEEWIGATGDVLTRKGLIPAHGNHEFLSRTYFAHFALPGNEEWFSIDYGPLTVVTLNDTVRSDFDVEIVQTAFLRDRLAASNATWKIVQHHQAGYSASTNHGSREDLRELWYSEAEAAGVDFVVTGHNHLYERSVPIRDEQEVAPGDGTVYFVTGGAGAPLYTGINDMWFTEVANATEHYVIMDLSATEAHIVARDLADNVIDEFTVQK